MGRVQCPSNQYAFFTETERHILNVFFIAGAASAGVLGGGQSVDTFKPGGGITAAKAYMTFVLAFVSLTSIIVSPASNFGELC